MLDLKIRLKKTMLVVSVMTILCAPAAPVFALDPEPTATDPTVSQVVDPTPVPAPEPVTPAPEVLPPGPELLPPTDEKSPCGPNEIPVEQPQNQVIDPSTVATTDITANSTAIVNNCIIADSLTGDASVVGNTTAGNAGTGDATAEATIVTVIDSATSSGGGTFTTFVSNVYGDVNTDLYIDPGALANWELTHHDPNQKNDITVQVGNSGQINNKLVLNAATGNADVTDNTTAGNATSGDAYALANLVNIINSSIGGNGFLGVLNIFGNLDGNILLPQYLLDGLQATDLAPSAGQSGNNSLAINQSNVDAINNTISANAKTGNALVEDNTKAGSAITGNALNDVRIINLTGHDIIGKNSLLVFVNVMGKWVGLILDAPAGSSAVALSPSGGAWQPGQGGDSSLALNANNNSSINNDITLNAVSGNASVTGNTTAGDARTGDATTRLNMINIINSQLSLSDWFGILFINIFGDWNGSVAIAPPEEALVDRPSDNISGQVVGFAPTPPASNKFTFVAADTTEADTPPPAPAGVTKEKPKTPGNDSAKKHFDVVPLLASGIIIGLTFLAGLTRKKEYEQGLKHVQKPQKLSADPWARLQVLRPGQ